MASKPKFNLDLNRITSGINLKETIDNIDTADNDRLQNPAEEERTFKKVPFRKLKSSKLNDYPIIAVDEMAHLLLAHGLLEPLNVSYVEDEDTYEIESGDRRFHALQNLYTKYEENGEQENRDLYQKNVQPLFLKGIPCMVENGLQDDDSKRIRIIIHNETNRPFDPIRTSNRLAELAAIYTRQNSTLPAKERININKQIAADLNGRYSVRQIIRYKNFDSLIDELKQVVIKHDMNIAEISNYHTLSSFGQSILAKHIEECYQSGKDVVLPSMEEISSLVPEIEESSAVQPEFELPPDAADSKQSQPAPVSTAVSENTNEISELKSIAVKKILESKDKKDAKLEATIKSLKKNASQLEKVVSVYLNEDRNTNLHSSVLKDIESISDTLTAIKNTLLSREEERSGE